MENNTQDMQAATGDSKENVAPEPSDVQQSQSIDKNTDSNTENGPIVWKSDSKNESGSPHKSSKKKKRKEKGGNKNNDKPSEEQCKSNEEILSDNMQETSSPETQGSSDEPSKESTAGEKDDDGTATNTTVEEDSEGDRSHFFNTDTCLTFHCQLQKYCVYQPFHII